MGVTIRDRDTIAAVCSGVGGAVSMIRVSGPDAAKIAETVFAAPLPLSRQIPRKLIFGVAKPDADDIGEPALAAYMPAPASYTGEDVVEIHSHGGVNSRRLLEALLRSGARSAGPGEFTYRAFMNGKMDLTQAEAVADLVAARGAAASRLAERQMSGLLGARVRQIRDTLTTLLAENESRLDFPEESLDFAPTETVTKTLLDTENALQALYRTRVQGKIFREGVRVVIAGAPNVGKSSLLNYLLGYERAITTAVPGTTRDTLEERVDVRGVPVKLIDTAGVRDTHDPIEKDGISRTLNALSQADVILWLLDADNPPETLEPPVAAAAPIVAVWNKIDLLPPEKTLPDTRFPTVRISVTREWGVEALLDRLESVVWGHSGELEPEVAVSARHADLIEKAVAAIADARGQVAAEAWELAAIGLRSAIADLGKIIGEEVAPDIYETIFSKFCVGK